MPGTRRPVRRGPGRSAADQLRLIPPSAVDRAVTAECAGPAMAARGGSEGVRLSGRACSTAGRRTRWASRGRRTGNARLSRAPALPRPGDLPVGLPTSRPSGVPPRAGWPAGGQSLPWKHRGGGKRTRPDCKDVTRQSPGPGSGIAPPCLDVRVVHGPSAPTAGCRSPHGVRSTESQRRGEYACRHRKRCGPVSCEAGLRGTPGLRGGGARLLHDFSTSSSTA